MFRRVCISTFVSYFFGVNLVAAQNLSADNEVASQVDMASELVNLDKEIKRIQATKDLKKGEVFCLTISLKNQHEMDELAIQGFARLINANNIQCIGLENHRLEASLRQLGVKGKFFIYRDD